MKFYSKVEDSPPITSKTASYTLALVDAATIQKCTSASAIVVTIPTNASVAFPVGTEIVIVRYGAGAVSVNPTSGVALYSTSSKRAINAQYEAATLKKMATNEWLLIGSLA